MAVKAVFLDKDGTLVEDVPYNADTNLITLMPGVKKGLRSLSEAGFELIVVSNQSGIARGMFKLSDLKKAEKKLCQLLSGVNIHAFYYCPHLLQGSVSQFAVDCQCRKPKPGLLLKAAVDRNIDLSNSWVIGDTLNDIEAGSKAGCKTVLINSGTETEWVTNDSRTPTFIASNLSEAVRVVLSYVGI